MTSDRKHPGVAFWATVVMVVLLVGYPLSWGPIGCVVTSNYEHLPAWAIIALTWYFKPVEWVGEYGPEWLQIAVSRYLMLWMT